MSGSFALERPLRIGYLGPPGSFSHEAAAKHFGSSVSYENLRTIEGVFEEVARGHVDYGLVPVENGTIGSVAETLEGCMHHCERVAVCAEVQLSVAQALIAVPGAIPSDIKVILSKPEAIAQCRRWLATQYPHAQLIPAASTSAAVETIAKALIERPLEARHMAAIGSKLAAQLHELPVMFPEIQDVTPNITRFLVLAAVSTASAFSVSSGQGQDKTSMLFVCQDKPGALRDVLDAFAKHDVNLSHIDKRPCPPSMLARLISIASNDAASHRWHLAPSSTAPHASSSSSNSNSSSSSPVNLLDNLSLESTPEHHSSPSRIPPSALVPSLLGGRGGSTLPFVYAFFCEAVGHITTPNVASALRDASEHCVCLKILGSFPKARRVL
jgi:prephenate dehydratase